MITKQTTPARRNNRIGRAAGSWRRMAVSVGMVAGALLLLTALFASRASALPPSGTSLSSDVRALFGKLADSIGLSGVAPAAHMQSHPLGINLPHGATVDDLPGGLAEYVRPGSVNTTVRMTSHALGINLPHGATVDELPAGLSDYIRPGSANTTVVMTSHALGINLPRGADVRELPAGLADYIRPGN